MQICHLVGGGDFLFSAFSPQKEDLVIACDAGLSHLMELHILPDLLVGDFDSYSGTLPNNVPTVKLPSFKDDTDMIYGAREGLARGYRFFLVHGGLGGSRLSHTLANLSLLSFLNAHAAKGVLVGKENTLVTMFPEGSHTLDGKFGFFSLFPVGDSTDVLLENTKYPLDHALSVCMPLGVSNEFVNAPAVIHVSNGSLYAVLENTAISPRQLLLS